MTNKKRSTAVLVTVVLAIALAVPAVAAETLAIRVSSYKGSTLEAGERSSLIIGPSGTKYTVTSSDPDIVAVSCSPSGLLSPSQKEPQRLLSPTIPGSAEP